MREGKSSIENTMEDNLFTIYNQVLNLISLLLGYTRNIIIPILKNVNRYKLLIVCKKGKQDFSIIDAVNNPLHLSKGFMY